MKKLIMKKLIILSALALALVLSSAPSSARTCIAWGPMDEWEECRPRDGSEPPSWCSGSPEGLRGWLDYGWALTWHAVRAVVTAD